MNSLDVISIIHNCPDGQQNLNQMERSTQNFLIGIPLIAIGIVLITSEMGADSSLGGAVVAVGAVFLILGVYRKMQEED